MLNVATAAQTQNRKYKHWQPNHNHPSIIIIHPQSPFTASILPPYPQYPFGGSHQSPMVMGCKSELLPLVLKITSIIQMPPIRLFLLCFLVVAAMGFAKNCQVFSPNSFNECSVCLKNYYLVNCQCLPCPTMRNSIKECSPSSTDTTQAGTNNITIPGNITPTTSNNASSASVNGTAANGMANGTNNGTNGIANGTNTTSNSSSNPSQTISTSNTTNTTNSPTNNTTSTFNGPSPSPSISDLAQIIFKILPPHCCDFTVTPTLACRACEKGYYLTTNSTCEKTPPPPLSPSTTTTPSANNGSASNKTVPIDLKVGSSLPIVTALPIVVNQPIPSPTPQPIFIPIVSPSPSLVTSVKPACPINANFDPSQPALGQNCPCMCFERFYYDSLQQQCLPVNPLCKTVGCQNDCLSCYIGYALINGKCMPSYGQITITASTDPNCQTFEANSTKCASCAKRYYFSASKGQCVAVDTSCQTWDATNGYCTSCFTGFTMGPNDKTCKPIASSGSSSLLDSSKCLKKVGGRCTSCAYRYFLSNGLCLQVSDQCLTFHAAFGYCTSCYGGYQLDDGVCQRSFPNCSVPAPNGCATCNPGYYSNSGECVPASLLCNGYDPQTGYCLDCIFPYTLDPPSGQCLYSP